MKLNKLMFAAMAVAALVAQPIYAIAASHTASAAGEIVVTSANMQGWTVYGNTSIASHVYAVDAPLGAGALMLAPNTDAEYAMVWKNLSSSVPANSINMSYDSKRLSGVAHAAPSFVLHIDQDGDDATYDTFYALYEPAYNGGTNYDSWNTWLVNPGAKFWYTAAYGARPAAAVDYTPLSNLLATMPNATVRSVVLNIGTGNGGWHVLTDNVVTPDGVYDLDIAQVVTNINTGIVYETLQSAVDAASAGDELRINQDITLTDDVDITKPLTIDGNGRTITASFVRTGNDNNSALSVLANDVTIKNVTLDGVNPAINQLHGINAYMVQNLLVDGVTAQNFRTGILYNGSTGTIQDVHTTGNIWHGINIDKDGANVNVLGNNTHTEDWNIYVDDDTKNVTVNAPAYEWSRSGLEGRDNDRVYRKKVVVAPETPVTPTEPTAPQGSDDDNNSQAPASGGSGATSSSGDSDVAVIESTTTTSESKDTEVLGADESEASTSSTQDTKEQKHWSLVNVLLAGIAVVMSIITLAGVRGSEGRAKWLRILTIIPAIGAVIAVLIVEDFTTKLGWVNGWTLLFLALVIAQAALRANAKPDEQ